MENTKNSSEKAKEKNVLLLPFVTALAGAILLVLAFFLPYASATKEHKQYLKKYSEEMEEGE